MSFKHLLVLFSVFFCISAKSLTLVIDTTYSMQNEINVIRTRIGSLISSIGNAAGIDNYVLVPFNDPDVGPAQSFTTPVSFINSINSLGVSGGDDIPENSLSGIEKALLESKPESDIFLFTDACAKDEQKFRDIERLCGVTRSKVIVFMSGSCAYSPTNKYGNLETYRHLTKVCFGNMFQLDQSNYEQAFTFMKEIIKNDYNEVKTIESFTGYHSLPFQVHSLTKNMIVAVTGGSPTLSLSDQNGQSPRTDSLIETQHSSVVRIVEPHRGLYQIEVRSQRRTSLTIYTRIDFPLQIGFSPLRPQSIEETTTKPLPGQESFIFVLVPRAYKYKLNTLTINFLKGDKEKTMALIESDANAHIYITQAFFEAGSAFRMTVNGLDTDSSDSIRLTSKAIDPQTEVSNVPWSGAAIQSIIPESSLTYYKNNATVACKVTGCPQPAIWWEDEDGQKIAAEDGFLEFPATYISYVTIPYITENKTISCKASTPTGKDSKTIQLYVYRPYVFRMIRTPEDTTIAYESEGKLYCEVDAYPEAEVSWYHNDKNIVFTTNTIDGDIGDFKFGTELDYFKEGNALVIRNMTSPYIGSYRCDVKNDANLKSFPIEVTISGLESPEVEMSDSELTSKLGDGVQISCRVSKGTPSPTVTWQYKAVDGFDFTDLPDDIEVEEEKLTINEVKSKHKGTYQCKAVNEQGQDSKEVNLKVIYAPKIENAETATVDVLHGKKATLECRVDAEPKARVRWERDGISLPDVGYMVEGDTLKFEAHYNDSGTYRCVAENEVGTAEKTINVNVNVKPYITSVPNRMTVRAGSSLRLSCSIEEGNPTPTLEWIFNALDSRSTVLPRSESELVLPRITKAQAGTYICIVTNKVGFDRIEIAVNVE